MPESDVPVGKLFSEVYVPKGSPRSDSNTARMRLYAYFMEVTGPPEFLRNIIAGEILKRLGVEIRSLGFEGQRDFESFFRKAELILVLNAVTIIATVLKERIRGPAFSMWIERVREVFREENLHYRVDDLGGVHHSPDEAFERTRVSAIAALQAPRYRAVTTEFNRAHEALDRTPPDGKGAVKAIFESIEILFRLMVDDQKCQRLSAPQVDSFLAPIVAEHYAADEPTGEATAHLVKSFKEWIAAAHFQRHGQPVEEPYQPSPGFAIALVSAGTVFLRWLAEIDQARQLRTKQPSN